MSECFAPALDGRRRKLFFGGLLIAGPKSLCLYTFGIPLMLSRLSMSVALDAHTLVITVIFTHSICACAIAFLRRRIPSIPGLRHFLLGTLGTVGALVLYMSDTNPPSVLSSIVGNFLSVSSAALILDGVLRLYGHKSWPPIWLLATFLLPVFCYWTLVDANAQYRVSVVIGWMSATYLAGAWTASFRSRGDERALSVLISLGFAALGVAYLTRLASMPWNPLAATFRAVAPSQASTFLLSCLSMIAATLGFALVATQRLVQELQTARQAAESGSRAKGDFLAVMSHEIRTPMNGVLGAASLILNAPIDERVRRYAETIETSGRAMLRIVDEVLDFSKIEAGGLTLERIPFGLTAEVESTVRAFQEAARVKDLFIVRLSTWCSWIVGCPKWTDSTPLGGFGPGISSHSCRSSRSPQQPSNGIAKNAWTRE